MEKKKNVYIIGNVLGAYRSQAILAILISSAKYTVNFSNFIISKKSNTLLHDFLKVLDVFITSIFRLYFLVRADIVFILPMNNNKLLQILTAKLFRKKIVADFYISYYDTRVIDRNWVKRKSFKAWLYLTYDRVMQKADKVFFLNNSELNYYVKVVQNKTNYKVHSAILPLCVEIRPKARLNFFSSPSTNIINICWWGTFIPLHGLDKIIESAGILRQKDIEFKIHLFGDSAENGLPFQKMIKEKNLISNVFLYNDYTFSNGKLEPYLIENCDLALGAFGDSEKAKTVITNKVIDAMSMKIPVISGYSSGIEEFFENGTDLFLCKNNPEEIAATLIQIMCCSRNRTQRIVDSASDKFYASFTYNAFKTKILKELENI